MGLDRLLKSRIGRAILGGVSEELLSTHGVEIGGPSSICGGSHERWVGWSPTEPEHGDMDPQIECGEKREKEK